MIAYLNKLTAFERSACENREVSAVTSIKVADKQALVAVVIPCYKVSAHILSLISNIGSEVGHIFVVDDC